MSDRSSMQWQCALNSHSELRRSARRPTASGPAFRRLAFWSTINMKKSIKVDQKKKRGRPATGRGTSVSARFPEPTVEAVNDWAARFETTRSDAIRRLVELGLKRQR